jgi:hypothetical protein
LSTTIVIGFGGQVEMLYLILKVTDQKYKWRCWIISEELDEILKVMDQRRDGVGSKVEVLGWR